MSLAGEIDIASAGDVEQELIRAEDSDAGAIVVDLSRLTFMDSTGIRMLLMAQARSHANGNRLVLRRPPEDIMRVLQLAGVVDRLPFDDG